MVRRKLFLVDSEFRATLRKSKADKQSSSLLAKCLDGLESLKLPCDLIKPVAHSCDFALVNELCCLDVMPTASFVHSSISDVQRELLCGMLQPS